MLPFIRAMMDRYTVRHAVSPEQYDQAKKDLSKKDFEGQYVKEKKYDIKYYYQISTPEIDPEDIKMVRLFLTDKLAQGIERANRQLAWIKWFMAAWIAVAVAAGIIVIAVPGIL